CVRAVSRRCARRGRRRPRSASRGPLSLPLSPLRGARGSDPYQRSRGPLARGVGGAVVLVVVVVIVVVVERGRATRRRGGAQQRAGTAIAQELEERQRGRQLGRRDLVQQIARLPAQNLARRLARR